MLELLNRHSESLYLLLGAVCLMLAAFGIFGTVFWSIRLAAAYAAFVVVPLTIGLLGSVSRMRVFTFLVLLGCLVTVLYIGAIFTRDAIQQPASTTSFIHERAGWVWLTSNFAELC